VITRVRIEAENRISDDESARSSILHEIDLLQQRIEGFVGGGWNVMDEVIWHNHDLKLPTPGFSGRRVIARRGSW
jgi:hypothetical protein